MTTDLLTQSDPATAQEGKAATHTRWAYASGWISLGLLLIAAFPLFLRMPLGCDVTHYDICAQNVLGGRVLYRDVFDTNLPGMVWLHMGIRSLLGWSSEAIRLVDFAIVLAIVWLLTRWLAVAGLPATTRVWTAVALLAFYLTTSEHAHCQRDVWMLLPALIALEIRRGRLARLSTRSLRPGKVLLETLGEGIVWGMACWIKPFVAVPALLCWLLSAVFIKRSSPRGGKLLVADAVGVLTGGLLVAGSSMAWLWWSGGWSYWWDVALSWNPEYYQWATQGWIRKVFYVFELMPWTIVHFLAIPLALTAIYRTLARAPGRVPDESALRVNQEALLGGLYLGWFFQATFLQVGWYYQQVPPLFLAMAIAARWRGLRPQSLIGLVNLLVLVGLAIVSLYPTLQMKRLFLWGRCLTERSSAELRDQLALTDSTDWQDLERVAAYLRSQDLRDGELTCFGVFTTPLYSNLNLRPSTRFIQLNSLLNFFPSRSQEIGAELARSRHRYLVTDVRDTWTSYLTPEEATAEWPGRPLALPPAFPSSKAKRYPWTEPVVFRAGRYYVHQVMGPPGSF